MPERFSFRFLPGCCVLCHAPSRRARDLCEACDGDLPRLDAACRTCAVPLRAAEQQCGICLRRPPPVHVTHAAFRYAYPLDALVQRFKFHRDVAAGRVLAEVLANDFQHRALTLPEALVPVPLHSTRLRERGYNQSEVLARSLTDVFGVPLAVDVAVRVRDTLPQSGRKAAERRRNLRGAFHCENVPGHVAVVDDVMTTGATLFELARALRAAGACRVDAWLLARTP